MVPTEEVTSDLTFHTVKLNIPEPSALITEVSSGPGCSVSVATHQKKVFVLSNESWAPAGGEPPM